MMGATPVIVETTEADGFRLRPDALAGALSKRTKAVILNTPSNPTGAAYAEADLAAIAEVLRGHDAYVVVDEIYADLVYDGFVQKSLLEIAPDLRERLILVDGVSKTYAMTGWRIGWILAPRHVAKACDTLQSQATTNPTAVAQHAATAALRGPRDTVETMRRTFEERRNVIIAGLNAIPGLHCRNPEGAFYAFVDVRGLYGKRWRDAEIVDDHQVAQMWLEDARCAAVPGGAFGAPGYVRMSYATSQELIREGLSRIAAAIAKLE